MKRQRNKIDEKAEQDAVEVAADALGKASLHARLAQTATRMGVPLSGEAQRSLEECLLMLLLCPDLDRLQHQCHTRQH